MSDPEGSWMQQHPNQNIQLYKDAIAKGYTYQGGDNWDSSGLAAGVDGKVATPGVGTGGAGGGGLSGMSSSYGSTSYGGKNPFATDAAAAKMRDEYARLKKSGKGAMDEGLASRGIFSSGVGARLQSEQDTQYGLAEGAALEDLYNRSAQQQMGFDLERQRMEMQQKAAMYGQGSHRYSGANTGGNANQDLMDYYSSKDKGNPSAPGYNTGGGSGVAGGSTNTGGDSGYVGSPSWKAEQARIKAIIDARNAPKDPGIELYS